MQYFRTRSFLPSLELCLILVKTSPARNRVIWSEKAAFLSIPKKKNPQDDWMRGVAG
jgi:hypothetical protein